MHCIDRYTPCDDKTCGLDPTRSELSKRSIHANNYAVSAVILTTIALCERTVRIHAHMLQYGTPNSHSCDAAWPHHTVSTFLLPCEHSSLAPRLKFLRLEGADEGLRSLTAKSNCQQHRRASKSCSRFASGVYQHAARRDVVVIGVLDPRH